MPRWLRRGLRIRRARQQDEDDEEEEIINILGNNDESEVEEGTTESDSSKIVNVTYDRSLPTAHSYLGNDLEEVSGRAYLEEEDYINLPIVAYPGVILVPGQLLPLKVFRQRVVSMLRRLLGENDKIFGVVNYYRHSDDPRPQMASIGTVAEIISFKEDEEFGVTDTVSIKAMGRHRFEIIETRSQADGNMIAKVKVLKEYVSPSFLERALPDSWRKFQIVPQNAGSKAVLLCSPSTGDTSETFLLKHKSTYRKYNKFAAASLTNCPQMVYRQYDTDFLMSCIKRELRSWSQTLNIDNVPTSPVEFSYWVTANLPLDDTLKLDMLAMQSAVQRLRLQLSVLQRCTALLCRGCDNEITNKNDVFSMSLSGPMAAYVNPGGYIHEMLTVGRVSNLALQGRPSTENSWFPGYAWTILNCQSCHSHMGWRFTAVKRGVQPEKFWGLVRSGVYPGFGAKEDVTEIQYVC